jgi:hypothetical protein
LLAIAFGALVAPSLAAEDVVVLVESEEVLLPEFDFISVESPALNERDVDLPDGASAGSGAPELAEPLPAGASGGIDGLTDPGTIADSPAPFVVSEASCRGLPAPLILKFWAQTGSEDEDKIDTTLSITAVSFSFLN